MTNKDLFRLAKISLAARKKSTKSTVRGIAFGLILLVPVLFIALGIFGDLNKKVNANPEVLYMNYSAAAERTGQADEFASDSKSVYNMAMSGAHAVNVAKNVKTDDVIVYEQIRAPFNPYMASKFESDENRIMTFDMKIGDEDIPVYLKRDLISDIGEGGRIEMYPRNSTSVPFAAIADMQKTRSESIFTRKFENKFGSVFVSGMDKGFTGGGKGQVVLSEKFIKSLGRSAEEFYGKKFSISFEDSLNADRFGNSNWVYINPETEVIDYFEDPEEQEFREKYYNEKKQLYFCCEYEVVGIIKEEVTQYAMDVFGVEHIMANMMFFTTASQYVDEGETLEPVVKQMVQDDAEENSYVKTYFMATYTRGDSETALLNREYMGFGANVFNSLQFIHYSSYDNTTNKVINPFSTTNVFVDAMTFAALDSAVGTLKAELSGVADEGLNMFAVSFASRVYSELSLVYTVFTYVVLAFSVMGGIIFFASMVNLFNSIVHSVDSRKTYLGVLRAVGAKRSLINKMYMAESLTIFKRALIWILIFATVICVGIALLLNLVLFGYLNESGMLPFTLAVSYVYIPAALGIALGVLLLLGFAFSYGCSWKVSRDPITKTLAG